MGRGLLPIAIRASHSQSVLETGLTIASIPSGVLLGVFLLGVLTQQTARTRRHGGRGGGAGGDSLCLAWHAHRVHLVCADRDAGHVSAAMRRLVWATIVPSSVERDETRNRQTRTASTVRTTRVKLVSNDDPAPN